MLSIIIVWNHISLPTNYLVRQLVVTMASEWNNELVPTFIDEFKKYQYLWDPKDTDRKSKIKKK